MLQLDSAVLSNSVIITEILHLIWNCWSSEAIKVTPVHSEHTALTFDCSMSLGLAVKLKTNAFCNQKLRNKVDNKRENKDLQQICYFCFQKTEWGVSLRFVSVRNAVY